MTKVECSDCEEEHRAASAKETKAPETQTNPEPEPDTHVEVEPARGDRNQRRELYSWYCSRLLLRCEAPELAAILPGSKSGTTAWYCGPTRIPPPPARTHTHTVLSTVLRLVSAAAAMIEATHHARRRCSSLNFLLPSSCWYWVHYRTDSFRRRALLPGLGLSSCPKPLGSSPASRAY